jgi:biopolymer transport protein ExbB
MWLLAVCSVLAGAVFLAMQQCEATPGPVARVILAAIVRHDAPRAELRDIVQEAGQLEVARLERRLALLATIALTAPLIGLLGSVVGLMDAFGQISAQSGFASATDIADGIYQALITTAGGLAVAIPSAVGYGYLNSRVNALLHDMERAGIEMVNLICDNRGRSPEIIEFTTTSTEVRRQSVE